MNKNTLTVSADGLIAAGKTMNYEFSQLSPFLNETSGTAPESLVKGGSIRAEYKGMFETLAHATQMSACMYMCADGLLDTSIYHSPSAGPAVSLSMADDGVQVETGADTGDILDWLAENAGTSLVRSCDFEGQFTKEETFVLFSMIDAARRKTMGVLAGCSTVTPAITIDDLSEGIKKSMGVNEEDNDNLQWLAPHFDAIYEIPEMDRATIQKYIQKFAQKGYVLLNKDGIALSDTLENLASNFFFVEGHLWLRSAEVDEDGNVNLTEVRGIRGRGNAVLLWTDEKNTISLMGASPAQVMVIAQDFLGQREEETEANVSQRINEAPTKLSRKEKNQAAKMAKQDGKKKKLKWWMIVLIVLALFTIFVILNLFFWWI